MPGFYYGPDNPGDLSGWESLIAPAIAIAPIPGAPLIAAGVATATASAGGSTTDAQRQARVNWTVQMAQRGSETAAAIIVAAPSNVASHERPMWQAALSQVPDTVMQAANAHYGFGGWWPSGQPDFYTDTTGATHRQIMSEVSSSSAFGVSAGQAVSTGVNTVANAVTRNPVPMLVIAGIGAALLLSGRRR